MGIIVYMLGIFDAEDVAHILYQSILKTSSGPEKRPFIFPSVTDAPMDAILAYIGRAWRCPESIHPFCGFLSVNA